MVDNNFNRKVQDELLLLERAIFEDGRAKIADLLKKHNIDPATFHLLVEIYPAHYHPEVHLVPDE